MIPKLAAWVLASTTPRSFCVAGPRATSWDIKRYCKGEKPKQSLRRPPLNLRGYGVGTTNAADYKLKLEKGILFRASSFLRSREQQSRPSSGRTQSLHSFLRSTTSSSIAKIWHQGVGFAEFPIGLSCPGTRPRLSSEPTHP